METLLKWLNKPKADDKSLLARFFHADRALAAVASELDSFDGRAEPDRCSRLVSRLRQGQDKVLAITNLIIEELLGDERDQRAFRAKFPEEVLQENLAGQLWFGAECLAAGSSIMNREQESKEMRPLAEAVTRSLNNVRYLLRDQCLRNNVPNSERLNLDKNDAATEQLYESLKRFDRLFAEFEWRYVSAMVQVKSKEEYEMQELICVLCSETLQRALKLGLLEQDKVDAFDPALMFSIPRLAIVSGLVIYPEGPLNMDMPAEQLSEMFRPFRSILLKVRDYLRNLNENELYYLERLLCTNEEISLKDTLNAKDAAVVASIQADNNKIKSSKYSENSPTSVDSGNKPTNSLKTTTTTTSNTKLQNQSSSTPAATCKTFKTKVTRRADSPSPAPSTTSSSSSNECSPCNTPVSSTPSSPRSTHSLVSTTSVGNESENGTTSPDSWIDDENDNDDEDLDNGNFLHGQDEDDHYADDDDSDMNEDADSKNLVKQITDYEDDDDDEDEDDEEDHSNNIYGLDSMVEQIINLEMASADCSTGYLISNTTLGNLLQPQEVPLTDNFIVSDSNNEEDCNENLDVELPSTSARALNSNTNNTTTLNGLQDEHLKQQQHHVDYYTLGLSSDRIIESNTTNPFIDLHYANGVDEEAHQRQLLRARESLCNNNSVDTSEILDNNPYINQQIHNEHSLQSSVTNRNYVNEKSPSLKAATTTARNGVQDEQFKQPHQVEYYRLDLSSDNFLENSTTNPFMDLQYADDTNEEVQLQRERVHGARETSRNNNSEELGERLDNYAALNQEIPIDNSLQSSVTNSDCVNEKNPSLTTTTSTSTISSASCTRRRRYSNDLPTTTLQSHSQQHCTKDHTRSHRHHHRHHHHHHHHHHQHHQQQEQHQNHSHSSTSTLSSNQRSSKPTNQQQTNNQSHHRHRVHHAHNHHHHHNHHRRPHRHGGDKQHSTVTTTTESTLPCVDCSSKEDPTMENSKATSSIGVLDIETPSSSSSLLEDNKMVVRSLGRTKIKNTENLLHRLFVCIAGVADQLQTNFAFDLRQILRSVFLMNMSPAQEELDIPEKPKENELFEFRASENDVIQESAGSSQSIYSAEEVNPEGDNQSNSSSNSSSSGASSNSSASNEGNRAYRHSTGTTITATENNEISAQMPAAAAAAASNQRQQIERSRSLDNQNCLTAIVAQSPNQQQLSTQQLRHQNQNVFRNRNNSTGSNSPSISSSENSSPICERSTTTTTNTTNQRVLETNANQHQQHPNSPVHLSPPAWIPDQKAPRCMSCNTPFTAFRRRHHCRNCGGVFCGVCSNNSTPLPKYGLTKAVRVCRSCFHVLNTVYNQQNQHHNNQHHHQNHSQLVSQTTTTTGGTPTTNTTNNEPRLRRPVTTTRAID